MPVNGLYIIAAAMAVVLIFVGYVGYALHRGYAVSTLHKRRLKFAWIGATIFANGFVSMLALGMWDHRHPAGTSGHLNSAQGQHFSWVFGTLFVVGVVVTIAYSRAADKARINYERKREQTRALAHNQVKAEEEVEDPRSWIPRLDVWSETFAPMDRTVHDF